MEYQDIVCVKCQSEEISYKIKQSKSDTQTIYVVCRICYYKWSYNNTITPNEQK